MTVVSERRYPGCGFRPRAIEHYGKSLREMS